MAKATTSKSAKKPPANARRAPAPAAPKKAVKAASAAEPTLSAADVQANLDQLAGIRAKFAPLPEKMAKGFFNGHSAEQCRERGGATRAVATFRGAMAWARTLGEHASEPFVNPSTTRWFLDCLSALGEQLAGRAPGGNPAAAAALDDVTRRAELALRRARMTASHVVASHPGWNAALTAALTGEQDVDPTGSRLRRLAAQFEAWMTDDDGPPLDAVRIDAAYVASLRTTAQTLTDALAQKPAAAQADRDSPAVNTIEGRLYFAMKVIWDELATAREDGATSLTLPTSPVLQRGLNLDRRGRAPASAEPATPAPAGEGA